MTPTPKIEKGIAIPPMYDSGRSVQRIIRAMAVGDSIMLESAARVRSFLTAARVIGAVVTSRKINGQGTRLWLLEAPNPQTEKQFVPDPQGKGVLEYSVKKKI